MDIVSANSSFQNEQIKSSELAAWLISRGISSITTDEIASLLGIPRNQVPQRLAPTRKRKEMVLLSKGLWAPVPPEYKTWGAPPAIDIIDSLMRYHQLNYYIGWLSAAALHGASHHAPQVFQVAVSRAIRAKTIGRSRFQFYNRVHVDSITKVKVESKNGMVFVSSRETTLLDIANDIAIVGGLDNATNLIIELCDEIPDVNEISIIAENYPSSTIRRLGYIMENFTDVSNLVQLESVCNKRSVSVSLLDPQISNIGAIDKRWQLIINRKVNPDV